MKKYYLNNPHNVIETSWGFELVRGLEVVLKKSEKRGVIVEGFHGLFSSLYRLLVRFEDGSEDYFDADEMYLTTFVSKEVIDARRTSLKLPLLESFKGCEFIDK